MRQRPFLVWTIRLAIAGAVAACAVALAPLMGAVYAAPQSHARALPAPAVDVAASADGKMQVAIVSGGCFWGVQGVFQHVRGVAQAVSGYTGGSREGATYDEVSSGATKHAESVMITFDPKQISYGQILRIFFSVATDPTQVNRQYPDVGPQYRSEIWYRNGEQKRVAEAYIAQLNAAKVFPRPIATRVDPSGTFYRAESYHQDYLIRHPAQPYIAIHDLPKIEALKRAFPNFYRSQPVLTARAAS